MTDGPSTPVADIGEVQAANVSVSGETAILTLYGEDGAARVTIPEDMVTPVRHQVQELGRVYGEDPSTEDRLITDGGEPVCETDGCDREPFDRHGHCGECLNYMDGTYGTPMTDGGVDDPWPIHVLIEVIGGEVNAGSVSAMSEYLTEHPDGDLYDTAKGKAVRETDDGEVSLTVREDGSVEVTNVSEFGLETDGGSDQPYDVKTVSVHEPDKGRYVYVMINRFDGRDHILGETGFTGEYFQFNVMSQSSDFRLTRIGSYEIQRDHPAYWFPDSNAYALIHGLDQGDVDWNDLSDGDHFTSEDVVEVTGSGGDGERGEETDPAELIHQKLRTLEQRKHQLERDISDLQGLKERYQEKEGSDPEAMTDGGVDPRDLLTAYFSEFADLMDDGFKEGQNRWGDAWLDCDPEYMDRRVVECFHQYRKAREHHRDEREAVEHLRDMANFGLMALALDHAHNPSLVTDGGEDDPDVMTDGGQRTPKTLDGGPDVHETERCDGAGGDPCVRDDPELTRGEDMIHVTEYGPGASRSGRHVRCDGCNDKQTALFIAENPGLADAYQDELTDLVERFPDILGDVDLPLTDGGEDVDPDAPSVSVEVVNFPEDASEETREDVDHLVTGLTEFVQSMVDAGQDAEDIADRITELAAAHGLDDALTVEVRDSRTGEPIADGGTDPEDDGTHYHPRDSSVPLREAIGYLHCATDTDLDPVPGDGYWIPVGEQRLVEETHPPNGHIIQYPKDDREPSRVGDKEVPDHVQNWDHRDDPEVMTDGGEPDVPLELMNLARHLHVKSRGHRDAARDAASEESAILSDQVADAYADSADDIRELARWLDGDREDPPAYLTHGMELATGGGVPWRDSSGNSGGDGGDA